MRWPFQRWFEARIAILDSMDPARIYVENVRSLLGVNTKTARWLCERACRDGLLEHWIALENPERGRTLLEHRFGETLDRAEVVDEVAEQLGDKSKFTVEELRPVDFYRGTT
jgi:hypothetical protein